MRPLPSLAIGRQGCWNSGKRYFEGSPGSWINSKVYDARNKKTGARQRMKATEVLNGPVAEMLGREQDWWRSVVERTGRVKKIRTIEESDENKRPKRIRSDKRQGSPEVQDQSQNIVSKPMPSVASQPFEGDPSWYYNCNPACSTVNTNIIHSKWQPRYILVEEYGCWKLNDRTIEHRRRKGSTSTCSLLGSLGA